MAYPHVLYREPGAFQQSRLESNESSMVFEIHQRYDVHRDRLLGLPALCSVRISKMQAM
jgi:hypothetical protein